MGARARLPVGGIAAGREEYDAVPEPAGSGETPARAGYVNPPWPARPRPVVHLLLT